MKYNWGGWKNLTVKRQTNVQWGKDGEKSGICLKKEKFEQEKLKEENNSKRMKKENIKWERINKI